MKILLFILVLISVNLNAQFDLGQLTKSSYQQSYLNIEVEVPENWWLRLKDNLTVRTDTGFKNQTLINKLLDQQMPVGMVSEIYLFMLQKYNPNLRIKRFIPTIFLTAENISNAEPKLRDVGQYLYKAKEKMANEPSMQYEIKKGLLPMQIGTQECYYMDAKVQQGEQFVNQRFVSFLSKEFAVSFVLVYQTEEELKELLVILSKAKL